MGIVCAKQEYSVVIIRKQRVNEYPIKELVLGGFSSEVPVAPLAFDKRTNAKDHI